MNAHYGSLADEFYTSTRVFLKLELSLARDTVLHFFEQIRKAFPGMRRFYRREDGPLVLEDQRDAGRSRRWVRLEPNSLRFGHFAPQLNDDFHALAPFVLDQAPYHLGLGDLDIDHMEVVMGFDLEYQGNHDQLLADTFWADHPLGALLHGSDTHHVIDAQPYLGIALNADCDIQAYVEVKSRTGTYEIRTGDYESQSLGVFLTLRKYWGFGETGSLGDAHRMLTEKAEQLAAERVVPLLVNPLAQAIASRS